jgi:hypothetical protein
LDAENDNRRVHPRTSMFVLATMAAASATGPIKIRNMSLGGALIEGGTLPPIGEHLSLCRGELAISGRIVWRQPGKAGLCFDHEVDVVDWLPAGSVGQQRVDRTFHELKTNAALSRPVSSAPIETSPVGKLDLLSVAAALDILADSLAEDAGIIAAYSSKLQVLDAASQMLRRFAASATSPPSYSGSAAASASRSY